MLHLLQHICFSQTHRKLSLLHLISDQYNVIDDYRSASRRFPLSSEDTLHAFRCSDPFPLMKPVFFASCPWKPGLLSEPSVPNSFANGESFGCKLWLFHDVCANVSGSCDDDFIMLYHYFQFQCVYCVTRSSRTSHNFNDFCNNNVVCKTVYIGKDYIFGC